MDKTQICSRTRIGVYSASPALAASILSQEGCVSEALVFHKRCTYYSGVGPAIIEGRVNHRVRCHETVADAATRPPRTVTWNRRSLRLKVTLVASITLKHWSVRLPNGYRIAHPRLRLYCVVKLPARNCVPDTPVMDSCGLTNTTGFRAVHDRPPPPMVVAEQR